MNTPVTDFDAEIERLELTISTYEKRNAQMRQRITMLRAVRDHPIDVVRGMIPVRVPGVNDFLDEITEGRRKLLGKGKKNRGV